MEACRPLKPCDVRSNRASGTSLDSPNGRAAASEAEGSRFESWVQNQYAPQADWAGGCFTRSSSGVRFPGGVPIEIRDRKGAWNGDVAQ